MHECRSQFQLHDSPLLASLLVDLTEPVGSSAFAVPALTWEVKCNMKSVLTNGARVVVSTPMTPFIYVAALACSQIVSWNQSGCVKPLTHSSDAHLTRRLPLTDNAHFHRLGNEYSFVYAFRTLAGRLHKNC